MFQIFIFLFDLALWKQRRTYVIPEKPFPVIHRALNFDYVKCIYIYLVADFTLVTCPRSFPQQEYAMINHSAPRPSFIFLSPELPQ